MAYPVALVDIATHSQFRYRLHIRSSAERRQPMAMAFVDAVRVVYNLANGLEVLATEDDARERQDLAGSQSEALNVVCEWLEAASRS
jgi:hypothetical protein